MLNRRVRIKISKMLGSLAGKLPVALLLAVSPAAGQVRTEPPALIVHFLDVGEGDAVLLELDGKNKVLLDSGNLKTGFSVLSYLEDHSITALNALIISHLHPDHFGGVFFLIPGFHGIEHFFDNGDDLEKSSKFEDIYRWYGDIFRTRKSYRALKEGDELKFGKAVLKVLWPPAGRLSGDRNENSLVIMLAYGDFRALFMGDAGASVERVLLQKETTLKASLLKAGHHAASDTGSGSFIREVSPVAVVVSVDRENINGYPDRDVLGRYRKSGAVVYRTDRDGSVEAVLDRTGKVTFSVERNTQDRKRK